MIRVGIIGASGYGGAELLRLIGLHPRFRVSYLASESDSGKAVADVYPQFRGALDLSFEAYDRDRAVDRAEVFFLPVVNGRAMKIVPGLLEARRGVKVVDISADFRFKDPAMYAAIYRIEHTCPDLLREAVYGLTELARERLAEARLVGNPGCYATAAILSIDPLLRDSAGRGPLVDPATIIVDAYSGVSGAGRNSLSLDYHFPEVNDSLTAYKVTGHRHIREIEQAAAARLGQPPAITFTPHLAPIGRGILATTYATMRSDLNESDLRELYQQAYQNDPFVVVLPEGEIPRTGAVKGTNYVQISVHSDPRTRRATIVAAEDNLGKGMCGQAIQNMNLLCGLPEESGLPGTAIYP